MDLLRDRIGPMYFKYLAAASGSAMVASIFGMVDAMMVGKYHGPIGSAALAVGSDLMVQYGVDSQIGRTVAVMLGSTETTFYAISVYFGAAGIRKTRYAIPAALLADLTGFVMASLTTRWFWS